jgi:putative sigma-54 modulation protein
MTIPMNITGHHVEVTPPLKDYVTEKLNRLGRNGDHITRITVTLGVEKLRQIAKATIHVKGSEIYASDEAPDMYAAIDGLSDKLSRQIKKHRENVTDHHPNAKEE